MRTYTRTGTISSAAGCIFPCSPAIDIRFKRVVVHRKTHCNLSFGVLYAEIAEISA